MTNYLIRNITDSTGHTFVEVIKPRENERYEIVSADSKEDVLSWYKEHKERTDWKSIDRKDSE
ncbi:hypothetical protein ASS95_07145 [Staphylococcus equorum]|uniref:DUF1381 domain-containing protein n=1 Tax=Staphylococcus equorum TaxID=246432 RepID=UPI000852C211|nr:hypothetical protein ASS95_07145 [Staphylococcus equorum]